MKRMLSIALAFCCAAADAATPATTDAPPDPNATVLPWFNGVIASVGTNLACLSDPPIFQVRVQGYAGYSLRPPNFTPAVGEVFYTHLLLSHPGNPCGGSAVGVELLLPPGVETAASAANPAFCFARVPNGPRLINLGNDTGYGCPQTFPQGLEGLRFSAPRGGFGGGSWGMAQGVFLEFLVPLRATAPQFGASQIRWRVNPDIGVVGYVSVAPQVNNDVIFRTPNEDDMLILDLCGLTPTAQGC